MGTICNRVHGINQSQLRFLRLSITFEASGRPTAFEMSGRSSAALEMSGRIPG